MQSKQSTDYPLDLLREVVDVDGSIDLELETNRRELLQYTFGENNKQGVAPAPALVLGKNYIRSQFQALLSGIANELQFYYELLTDKSNDKQKEKETDGDVHIS